MAQGIKTSLDMDNFMRDLMTYSEFSQPDNQEAKKMPESIQRFNNNMADNNSGSIFDDPVYYNGVGLEGDQAQPSNTNNENKVEKKKFDWAEKLNMKEKDELTFANKKMGRGRGIGRVRCPLQPGPEVMSNAEDITWRIQQTAGLGYSNALIEAHVKANQKGRTLEKTKKKSPQGSNATTASNTPRCVTPAGAKTPLRGSHSPKASTSGIKRSEAGGKSPRNGIYSPKNGYISPYSAIPSQLSENDIFSDASTDSYYTVQESSGEITTDTKESVNVENSDFQENKLEMYNSPVEEIQEFCLQKPLPLSQMLKKARAERKLRNNELNPMAPSFDPTQLDKYAIVEQSDSEPLITNSSAENDNWEDLFNSTDTETSRHLTESEAEEASQQLISKIIMEDEMELERRRNVVEKKQKLKQQQAKQRQLQQYTNWLSKNDTVNPSSGSSSSDEALSWRRRGDSPPKHAWASKNFNLKPLNISSVKDFPTLK